ncbi:hypothetical protein SAMN02910298_02567 [Pseudobutyrivibrio sp. YE44]|nr:hypothetical protein SAMN02910298_02567 [Pseudobutyrivibrio sp. YE44]
MPVFNKEDLFNIQALNNAISKRLEKADNKVSLKDVQVYLGQIYRYTETRAEDWNATLDAIKENKEEKYEVISKLDAQRVLLEGILEQKNLKMMESYAKTDEYHFDFEYTSWQAKEEKYVNYLNLNNAVMENIQMDNHNLLNISYDAFIVNKDDRVLVSDVDLSRMIDKIRDELEPDLNDYIRKQSVEKGKKLLSIENNLKNMASSQAKEDPEYLKADKKDKPEIWTRKKKEILDELLKENNESMLVEQEWANRIEKEINAREKKAETVLKAALEQGLKDRRAKRDEYAKPFLQEVENEKAILNNEPEKVKKVEQEKPIKSGLKKSTRRNRNKTDSNNVIPNEIQPDSKGNNSKSKDIVFPKGTTNENYYQYTKDLESRRKINIDNVKDKTITTNEELLKVIKKKAEIEGRGSASGFVGDANTVVRAKNIKSYRYICGRELLACEQTFSRERKTFQVGKNHHIEKIQAIHNLLRKNKKTGLVGNSTAYTNLLTKLDSFEKDFKKKGWAELLKPEKQDINNLTDQEKKARAEMLTSLHDVYWAGKDYMVAKGPEEKFWAHGQARYELTYLLCSEIYTFGGHAAECEARIKVITNDIKNKRTTPSNYVKQIPDQASAVKRLNKKYGQLITTELSKMGVVDVISDYGIIDNEIKNPKQEKTNNIISNNNIKI